jgi:hypothetical protein
MYVIDGIAYAGEVEQPIKVVSVRPLDDHKIWLRFSTGEEKEFDCSQLLGYKAFEPLRDPILFRQVYLEYGNPSWCDGTIDIAPEKLYQEGVQV